VTSLPRCSRQVLIARHGCGGVSLIELIVFILVVGVVIAGLVIGMSSAVRTAPQPREMHQGLQLAQGRMELILAQRTRLDFGPFTNATFDPCVPPGGQEACLAPTNYAVTSCFFTGAGTCGFGATNTCNAGDANYKCVRVRVTGPDGAAVAELDAMVANY